MNNFKKVQESLAGRFTRKGYNKESITVQVVGIDEASSLTNEQIDYIKAFYNRPSAKVEINNNLIILK